MEDQGKKQEKCKSCNGTGVYIQHGFCFNTSHECIFCMGSGFAPIPSTPRTPEERVEGADKLLRGAEEIILHVSEDSRTHNWLREECKAWLNRLYAIQPPPTNEELGQELRPDFVWLLSIAEGVFAKYKVEQPRWWKRMDGTPILNDVAVRMAEAFRDALLNTEAKEIENVR